MNNKDNNNNSKDNISMTIEKMMKSDENKNNIINDNQIDDNENLDSSQKSYHSMFSIISKKDSSIINELNDSDSNNDNNNIQLNRLYTN